MILIIDNTKNLEQALMTPNIINVVKSMGINFKVISQKMVKV